MEWMLSQLCVVSWYPEFRVAIDVHEQPLQSSSFLLVLSEEITSPYRVMTSETTFLFPAVLQ